MRLLNPARQPSRRGPAGRAGEPGRRRSECVRADCWPPSTVDGRRNRGNKSGRHRQARPDYQWEKNEDHEQVAEPLQHVIRPGFCRTRPFEPQMAGDHARENTRHERSALRGSKFFLKCPLKEAERSHTASRSTPAPRQIESGDTGSSRSGPAARSRSRSAPMPSRKGSAV